MIIADVCEFGAKRQLAFWGYVWGCRSNYGGLGALSKRRMICGGSLRRRDATVQLEIRRQWPITEPIKKDNSPSGQRVGVIATIRKFGFLHRGVGTRNARCLCVSGGKVV